jgi:hypothetical protein
LYDRSSLAALESDVRTVSRAWFRHDEHDLIEEFVCSLPLAYVTFDAHDRYTESTRYEMATLVRCFSFENSTAGTTKRRSSSTSNAAPTSATNYGWRPSRTSRHCGAAGTSGSPPAYAKQSRWLLERS